MKITKRKYVRDGKWIDRGWRPDIFVKLKDGTRVRERPVYRNVTWTEAKAAAEKRAAWLMESDGRIDASKIPTLAAFEKTFIEYAQTKDQKASTIAAKESILKTHLVPVLGAKRLDQITELDLHTLALHLKNRRLKSRSDAGLAVKTKRNVISTLSKLLRVAKRLGAIDEVPIDDFDLPDVEHDAVPPFYTFAEYAALIGAAEKHDPRTLVAVLLGGNAGLRAGEIVGLEWPDVSKADHLITINRQVWRGIVGSPKSGNGRAVPMTTRLATALAAVRHLRGDRVLLQDGDAASPLTAKVLKAWVKSAQRLAGLKATGNVHILRHTFCSHLAMRGAPAKAIQELAGHTSLSTTMQYMHLAPGHKEAAIALLEQSTEPAKATAGVAT